MSANSESRWKRRGQRENNEANALRTQIEATALPRSPRAAVKPSPPPSPYHRKAYIRGWMRANAQDYESATQLAEAAEADLDLPEHWLNDPNHWIWDLAADGFYPER